MSIKFRCPSCNKKLSAPDSMAGRQHTCPQCRSAITIPLSSTPVPRAFVPTSQPTWTDGKEIPLVRPVQPPAGDLIDMTAMVDIVFFLLIFFLVTSIQSLEAVMNLPTPQSDASAAPTAMPTDVTSDPANIVVTIDEDDTVWVEDEEVFGEQNLRARLRELRREDEGRDGLLVIGDPDATHGTLVMVLDAGADAGLTDLMFSVGEQPESGG